MNWKYRISLVLAIVLIAAVWLKLPSQADTDSADTIAAAADADNAAASHAQGKITQYPNGVSKIEPMNFAVSGRVRDMPTIDPDAFVKSAAFKDAETRREERREKELKAKGIETPGGDAEEINQLNEKPVKTVVPGAGAGDGAFSDPLVNKQSLFDSPLAMPTPSLTFDGATQADNAAQGVGSLYPPDVNGDVGPNHYVSSVNLVLKMFNKSGTIVSGPIKTSALFAALPATDPCRLQNDGDPIVMYDSLCRPLGTSANSVFRREVKHTSASLFRRRATRRALTTFGATPTKTTYSTIIRKSASGLTLII